MTITEGNFHQAPGPCDSAERHVHSISRRASLQRCSSTFHSEVSPAHKGNHETPDTRRARHARNPSVPPFSIASGKIVTRPETHNQSPLGAFRRAQKALSSPVASSQKKHTARVGKHCHNLSYGLPTADRG